MYDNFSHISTKTRQRAITLAENANGLGMDPGTVHFDEIHDFMGFWFTNGLIYVLIFCTPMGYLTETYETNEDGEESESFGFVKNIRHFLYYLRKNDLESFDEYISDIDDVDLEDVLTDD